MENNRKKKKFLGACCGIMTGICWGLSGVFSQYLFTNTTMQSEWFVAVRMLVSGLCMLAVSLIFKREELCILLKNRKDAVLCIITGILGTMLFQFSCYGAVQRSNAATAIVLQYLCPVMVMIYVCMKNRKLPKCFEVVALLFAMAGIFLISTHGNLHELVITGDALLFGIGCAFFMMLSTVIPEGLYERYSTQTITSLALFSGGVVAGMIVHPMKNPPALDAKAMAAFLLAVFCGSILAYLVYAAAIKQIGSGKASLFACAEIPTATVLSVVFLGNEFIWMDIVGFVLIGSTIFILSAKKGD